MVKIKHGKSTVKQIFNSQVTIKKHLQHQHNLFNNFILLKTVRNAGLWWILRSFNIAGGLVQDINALQVIFKRTPAAQSSWTVS